MALEQTSEISPLQPLPKGGERRLVGIDSDVVPADAEAAVVAGIGVAPPGATPDPALGIHIVPIRVPTIRAILVSHKLLPP